MIAAAFGEALLPLDKLDAIATSNKKEIQAFVDKEQVDRQFSLTVADGVKIGPKELTKAREVRSESNPYEGVGKGKPLTIVIESVYLGDYPDTMPLVPWIDEGDVLVTSAHKAFEAFDAAPRAVHLLEADAKPRSWLKAKAVEQGSQLVYYSPAVTGLGILFSVELSVDRELNSEIGPALGKAVAAAGALPVFAPAAPFLVAAGTAIPIAAKAASMLARPQTFFGDHPELNIDRPGVKLIQQGTYLLSGGDDRGAFPENYKVDNDFKLRDDRGRVYKGPRPYVVISLDGTKRDDLKQWSAQAASAVLLERFFNPDELISKALGLATEGMVLFNDVTYQRKAADALKKSKKAKGAEKKRLEDLYKAYVENIQTKEIRDSVDTKA